MAEIYPAADGGHTVMQPIECAWSRVAGVPSSQPLNKRDRQMSRDRQMDGP